MSDPTTLDVHAHFLPPVYREALAKAGLKTVDGGMPVPDWSPERALAIMDEVGIAGAVLSVSSPHVSFLPADEAAALCRAVNDYAADLCGRYPDRFGAYAILPLPDVAASLAELARALDDLSLDGVALPTHADGAYLGDAKFAPVLEALDARSATVFIHPTAPACFEAFGLALPAPMIEFPFDTTRTVASLIFSGALERFARIRFILPHAGGTLPFLATRMAAIGAIPALGARARPPAETMQTLARLHYDTALAAAPHQIAALRAIAPVSQIVYGTDFPFAPEPALRAAEAQFQAIPFTPDEREQVRMGNARRLFAPFAARCCGGRHA
ncbi:amidohydrolase family protein [Phenylobacterium sp.]|uniref:amidohydrolase family protein n=1 Tax=Phenylobacterium sp. TaxID=1871053 RepID=UPI0025FC5C57|nr:amidohydrolase family protein [Phenylobacterium sp.]